MPLQEDIDFLTHAGVKGMKWGVRRQRRANTHVNVGKGKGTKSERLRSAATVSPLDLARGKGFKGAARIRGKRQTERNARVAAGEASVKDKIAFYGGSRYQDMFPTGKSSNNTKAAIGASVVGVIIASQVSGMVGRALVPR